ncbi:MAG: ferritin-like domain-containing protein [Verrucomicrobiae bacterium]|nr:ferritin-like domain-containing protein [Verrucomicrobiae bacterium]
MATSSKGDKQAVIDVLNKARAAELAAILQYMSQHYELADNDYGQFAQQLKLIAIDEMRHAEMLAERILILGGTPTSKPDMETKKKQPVLEIFKLDEKLEDGAVRDYNEFLQVCREARDYVSAKVFELLIVEEQIHLEHFQDIIRHIEELGDAYLATQVGGAAEGPPARGFVASQGGAADAQPQA